MVKNTGCSSKGSEDPAQSQRSDGGSQPSATTVPEDTMPSSGLCSCPHVHLPPLRHTCTHTMKNYKKILKRYSPVCVAVHPLSQQYTSRQIPQPRNSLLFTILYETRTLAQAWKRFHYTEVFILIASIWHAVTDLLLASILSQKQNKKLF